LQHHLSVRLLRVDVPVIIIERCRKGTVQHGCCLAVVRGIDL
jgi:hypothetical protein